MASIELLPTTDQEGAVQIIRKLMDVFDLNEVKVSFDNTCGGSGYCYTPDTNTIHLYPSERIPEYVIAHEFGHALQKSYAGTSEECTTYEECEGFATMFQSIYMVTNGAIQDFKCEVCGKSSLFLREDGRLICKVCYSEYYANLYDASKFSGKLYYCGECMRGAEAVTTTTTTTTTSTFQCAPFFADLLHILLGAVFPLGAEAIKPGSAKEGAAFILAFAGIKEFFFDPVAEGQSIPDSLKDFSEYFAGAGGSLVLIEKRRR